jgi:hypothetical protein
MRCINPNCDRDTSSYYSGSLGPMCRPCFEAYEEMKRLQARDDNRPKKRGFWEQLVGIFS